MPIQQMHDGDKFILGRGFRQVCCDCGLVHEWKARKLPDGRVELTLIVDKRGTAAQRRRLRKAVVIVED